ncbi:right-handed parallel beta-helix repeat-containing protein [Streptomyces sp. NPDC093094]|uniref:right-handed parallel beta-helix repeat-containing protein n=1 Tax=Streptomyces sp. NPDC093094 TaxID=3366026 RepID=UPI00380958F6
MKRTLPRRSAGAGRSSAALLSVLALSAAALSGTVMSRTAAASAGTTYYVSSSTGSNQNSGTSAASPWQSLVNVNDTTFQPGDTILLKAGDSWNGQLRPKGSGTGAAPIRINQYGTGAKPRIAGAGTVPDAVKLWNQEYWEIRNLDVSNKAPAVTSGTNLGDFRGIHVGGDNGTVLDHIVIDSVDVHDVTGELRWIWGDTNNTRPGVTYQNGWDRSKNTGGIVFSSKGPTLSSSLNCKSSTWPTTLPSRTGPATVFNDVTIENSSIRATSFAGIIFKQSTGDAPGAARLPRCAPNDPVFAPSTDVKIRNNYLTQIGADDGTNGMYLTSISDGHVERNLVDRVGTSGIELFATDDVEVQYNEVTGTAVKGGGTDANAIDTDIATTRSVVQYNYIHHNVEGILACACYDDIHFGDAVFRYNVLANNSKAAVHLANVSGSTTKVYNNTVYNTAPEMIRTDKTGGTTLFDNNIFHTTFANASMVNDPEVKYHNNLYGGTLDVPTNHTAKVIGDPQFADPTAGGTGTQATGPLLSAGLNWRPAVASPAVNAATTVADNGGVDYNGATVPIVPDIGALQHNPPSSTLFGDNFDALPVGALANGTNGWTVDSTGNEIKVSDTPGPTDKSVQLIRRQDAGGTTGTRISRTFPTALTGTVTIEADVMRNDGAGERNYFGLPYLYNSSGAQVVSVGFSEGDIVAYSGTTLQVVKPYTQGTWYHVKLVVDTARQNFDFDLNGRRILTDAAFRNSAPGIARMAFYANAGNGSAFVNNVIVH